MLRTLNLEVKQGIAAKASLQKLNLQADIMQRPLISCTQKIVIYETKARFYVVSSNNTETKFRVLKIDRMEPKELHVVDDKVEYSRKEIRDLLQMIDVGNRPRLLQKGTVGLKRTVSAFGIVGFVKFLEGYYMVLVTKRRRVALIGTHTVFKVEDTSMVYIPNDLIRTPHPDEHRYVKMFQNVDLSSNFYFSYSYDVTHALQYNMAPCNLQQKDADISKSQQSFWKTDCSDDTRIHDSLHGDETNVEDASCVVCDDLLSGDDQAESDVRAAASVVPSAVVENCNQNCNEDNCASKDDSTKDSYTDGLDSEDSFMYGVRMKPSWKYAWNAFLLKKVLSEIHSDWLLFIIHGFVGQSNINVFGRCVYVALIARRSNQFAGTRFLKRGANCQGYVANEVETEQIVYDASLTSLRNIRFTSFVQLRGSIPLHWSQDINKMVPKPPIILDQADPYGHVAGQHFNQLLCRYGAPIIILDLVKRREKKRHESIISQELVNVLHFLNQFLPSEHAIKYIGFDMARVSKAKNSNVLMRLAKIAEYCVKKTGFFQSHSSYHCREIRPHHRCGNIITRQRQHGVVRTNCVDCLDRTNTAQFAIGKTALAMQLHALGIIDSPNLDFETDCVRMMEDLYEDQGDTLALQYGGSQLVHRIKGYRKVAPWTSSSRDIMQTLSRYCSNAFSDSDKQNAINLFLGMFEPCDGQQNIWDLSTDFYLHNCVTISGLLPRIRRYTQWWDIAAVRSLPFPCEEETKGLEDHLLVVKAQDNDERIDSYWEHYRPYELTVLEEQFCFNMPNSIRDFMPKYAINFSAFIARVEPGRRQEESGNPVAEANPNVSGKDSTSSTTSTGSEGSTSGSEGSELEGTLQDSDEETVKLSSTEQVSAVHLKDLFATMKQTYGVEIVEPSSASVTLYTRYAAIGDNATCIPGRASSVNNCNLVAGWSLGATTTADCSQSVRPPVVSLTSRHIYQEYVTRGADGAGLPTSVSTEMYSQYAARRK